MIALSFFVNLFLIIPILGRCQNIERAQYDKSNRLQEDSQGNKCGAEAVPNHGRAWKNRQ